MAYKRPEEEIPFKELERQVRLVLDLLRTEPSKRSVILKSFLSNFFDAVKETLKKQGHVMPFYIIVADKMCFGTPPVTEHVARRASEMNAEAVISIEGFQQEKDISDVIYHISMSAPSMGVMGWVLKVKLRDGIVEFTREMPYLFDSKEKVKTLGQLIDELEKS